MEYIYTQNWYYKESSKSYMLIPVRDDIAQEINLMSAKGDEYANTWDMGLYYFNNIIMFCYDNNLLNNKYVLFSNDEGKTWHTPYKLFGCSFNTDSLLNRVLTSLIKLAKISPSRKGVLYNILHVQPLPKLVSASPCDSKVEYIGDRNFDSILVPIPGYIADEIRRKKNIDTDYPHLIYGKLFKHGETLVYNFSRYYDEDGGHTKYYELSVDNGRTWYTAEQAATNPIFASRIILDLLNATNNDNYTTFVGFVNVPTLD